MKMWHSRPAAAEYAAAADAALPAEGIATRFNPSSRIIVIAQLNPRALKLPVGFSPSSFTYNDSVAYFAPNLVVWTNGVMPSPNDTGVFPGSIGPYRHMLLGP